MIHRISIRVLCTETTLVRYLSFSRSKIGAPKFFLLLSLSPNVLNNKPLEIVCNLFIAITSWLDRKVQFDLYMVVIGITCSSKLLWNLDWSYQIDENSIPFQFSSSVDLWLLFHLLRCAFNHFGCFSMHCHTLFTSPWHGKSSTLHFSRNDVNAKSFPSIDSLFPAWIKRATTMKTKWSMKCITKFHWRKRKIFSKRSQQLISF